MSRRSAPALVAQISIPDPTELIETLRNQLAGILRDAAAKEDQAVGRRLREIADAFESDAGPPDGVVVDVNAQHDGTYAPHYPIVKA